MPTQHFTEVSFQRFKAFKDFSLRLRHFNILVGPNNAGKSTVLTAFRILAAGIRRAQAKRPTLIHGPAGTTLAYAIDLEALSVAEENLFHDYDDDQYAAVRFGLSDESALTLYFPERGVGYLIADSAKGTVTRPAEFKESFQCPVGFVPILGPVEHNERLYESEAARLALFSYQAARNFRNIWYHFPQTFSRFRDTLRATWPGMDILPPEIDTTHSKPLLRMFCPEERIPRELFWTGFGFQVWCQMLTHVIQNSTASLFLIDEPDIYLHADLQRQLLSILRDLGPDILLATHSTEIVSEADSQDIVIVNKRQNHGRRIKDPGQLISVFAMLGSNLNPVLTQLGKTRRVVFVEGKDFQVIGRFAHRLGYSAVGNRTEFAVIPLDGFNPERMRTLKAGMEVTLGVKVRAAIVLDRDFRSQGQCDAYKKECEADCDTVIIHSRKELENFLLIPSAIDRAARRRLAERAKRVGVAAPYENSAAHWISNITSKAKAYVGAQYMSEFKRYKRSIGSKEHEAVLTQYAIEAFDGFWENEDQRLLMIGGKDALSAINAELQASCSISLTPTSIIDAMSVSEIPTEMKQLVERLNDFAKLPPLP